MTPEIDRTESLARSVRFVARVPVRWSWRGSRPVYAGKAAKCSISLGLGCAFEREEGGGRSF